MMQPQQISAPNPSKPQTVVVVNHGSSPGVGVAASEALPLKTFHLSFGIIQMIIGGLMIVFEVAAFCASVPLTTGPGIYCGLLVFVAGLLSVLGAKFDSHPLIIACMIFNIFATIACSTGTNFASYEFVRYKFDYNINLYYHASTKYGYIKSITILLLCLLEFILTIVHASLTCRSVCSCCRPHPVPTNGLTVISGATGQQQGLAYQTGFPAQGGVSQQQPPPYVAPCQPGEGSQLKYQGFA